MVNIPAQGDTSNSTIPIVNAVMTPMTMALDGMFADRTTAAIAEMVAVAAISAAGAITHGISCVNHASVCILPLSTPVRKSVAGKPPVKRPSWFQAPPAD